MGSRPIFEFVPSGLGDIRLDIINSGGVVLVTCRFVCVSGATFQAFGFARDLPRCAAYLAGHERSATERCRLSGSDAEDALAVPCLTSRSQKQPNGWSG